MKVTVQNYKQLRPSFNLENVNPEALEVFKSVDEDFSDYLELYVDSNPENDGIREVINNHLELVNTIILEDTAVKKKEGSEVKSNHLSNHKKKKPRKVSKQHRKISIEKTVDAKEVSFFNEEYRLIRRFYNMVKKNEIVSFRSVQLLFMAFEKAALERKVRKTSKDAELFTDIKNKISKLFDLAKNEKRDLQIKKVSPELNKTLEEYVGSQRINYAITLVKSFVNLQGKKPPVIKAENLLKRIDSALEKNRITKSNRLFDNVIVAKKALQSYIESQNTKIPPANIGLSAVQKKKDNIIDSEFIDLTDNDDEFLEFHIKINDDQHQEQTLEPVKRNVQTVDLSNLPITPKTENYESILPECDSVIEKIEKTSDKPVEQPKEIIESEPIPEELIELGVKSINDDTEYGIEFFNLNGDLANFFGKIEKKPKGSVAITVDSPQGGGKTRMMFQAIDMFADAGYKGLFPSLEEHPDSALFKKKRDQYVKKHNQTQVHVIGELPNGFSDLQKLIPHYDYVVIDSWGKLSELNKALDFDRDLRKAFDGKVFLVVFQRTQDGKMRGGSNSAFDGDIITKIKKDEDFRKSYAFFDKNRYQDTPLSELKYNIFSQKLINKEKDNEFITL